MEIKNLGQVFTPKQIVNDILNVSNYKGKNILKKHVIDNSCGDGAFLVEIIDRYIKALLYRIILDEKKHIKELKKN